MSDISSSSEAGEVVVPPVVQELMLAAPAVALVPVSPEKLARERRFAVRAWSVFIFVMCAGMLSVGLWLTPNPKGVETHRQLGLPPCGFMLVTGYPCPTCGCTTAVSHFSHGQWVSSFLTQPFGFLVALIATLLVPLSLVGIVSGRWMGPSTFWLAWHWRMWVYGGLGFLLLAWGYKILMVRFGH